MRRRPWYRRAGGPYKSALEPCLEICPLMANSPRWHYSRRRVHSEIHTVTISNNDTLPWQKIGAKVQNYIQYLGELYDILHSNCGIQVCFTKLALKYWVQKVIQGTSRLSPAWSRHCLNYTLSDNSALGEFWIHNERIASHSQIKLLARCMLSVFHWVNMQREWEQIGQYVEISQA